MTLPQLARTTYPFDTLGGFMHLLADDLRRDLVRCAVSVPLNSSNSGHSVICTKLAAARTITGLSARPVPDTRSNRFMAG